MLREALPASREARRMLVGILVSAIGRGLTLPFLFVYLTEVRGLAAGTVGLLVGWMGAVALVLAPLGGSLMDRFGARRVMLPLLALEMVGTGSLAFVDSVGSAFVSLTLVAIGFAAIWSAQNTIMASLVDEGERQRVFGLAFTLLNLGIGTGGILGGLFVDASRPVTFQAIYFADATSYLAPALILLSMPHVGLRVALASDVRAERRGGYLQVLRDGAFVRFFVLGLAMVTFGYAQMEVGFTAFARIVAEVPARTLGLAFAGNTLVIVVAQLFVLRWLHGRSRTRALALAACIFAISWLVLAGAGVAGSAAPALAIAGVITCMLVFAVGETLLSPVAPAITNALAKDELRGRYNALAGMIWGLSGVVGPIAAGPLIGGGHGIAWVTMVMLGCLVAAALALNLRRHLSPAQDGRTDADHEVRAAQMPTDSALEAPAAGV